MGQTNQPDDILARLKRAERQIAELQRGQTLNGAVLSNGNLEVRTDDGHTIMKVGKFTYENQTVFGMALFRYDGSTQFWGWDKPGGGGYTSMWDESHNIIVSTDTVSGQGLATPYIPYTAVPFSAITGPPVTTTSSTFGGVHRIHGQKQHPIIRVQLVTQTPAGTTGEVRLMSGGAQIGSTVTVPSGDLAYRTIDAALPGGHLAQIFVDVEARRTGGAGAVGVAVTYCEGKQS